MTDREKLIERLRRMAKCIYIAVEEAVADDISDGLTKAAAELEANAAEIGRLREALELALTKVPHQVRCARLLPTSEWTKEKGNYDFSDCSCVRRQIVAALNKQESGNV